ncbi:16326_t:CDS:1 [Funneliformis geosporum]|uniref:7998_t:CDS:1 n=1 Tax=Funneliformis geosporum TaxID=1117311 RepID=A0A9W4SY74_9GLOM|nr:16326_t:CDS:1 [Funneliformis geosporum]CAI2185840.1 7998_t:CDS:1 [Funneliformis geosporum]
MSYKTLKNNLYNKPLSNINNNLSQTSIYNPSTNTSSKSLPSECLQHIFLHLSYSKSTLHSCLLVNRLWCVNVVKVLWSQPFHLLNTCTSSSGQCGRTPKDTYLKCAALINIYLSFLDREETNNLLNNRIILNNNGNSSKAKDKDNLNSYNEELTFNYIEFLRYLDLEELFITVGAWKQYTIFNSNTNSSSNYSNGKLIQKSSFKKTLKKAVNTLTKKSSSMLKRKSSFGNFSSLSSSSYTGNNGRFSVDGFPVAVDRVVSYSLAKLIMNKCNKLKVLSIDTRIDDHHCHCLVPINETATTTITTTTNHPSILRQNVPEEHLLIATYPGSNKCLPPLTEFICTTRGTKWRLFHALAGICKQLKRIVIDMGGYTNWLNNNDNSSSSINQQQPNSLPASLLSLTPYTEPQMQELEWEAKNLATLLQSQVSLESFTLLRGEIGLLTILGALKSQVNSLKHLEFVQLNTKYAQWGAFYNILDYVELKELVFKECELSDELMRPLTITTSKKDAFKRIEVLNFEKSIASKDIIGKFIKVIGSNLKRLLLGDHYVCVSPEVISLIEITGQYCPNLTHFTTFVDINDIPRLLTLFTLCPLLQSVELSRKIIPQGQDESLEDAFSNIADVTYLFEQMASQNLLYNLKRLVLRAPWSFTPVSLESYLCGVKPPLKCLEISQSYSFDNEHLKVLIKYAKEKQQLKKVLIETLHELDDNWNESLAIFEVFEYHRIRQYHLPGYFGR